MYEVMRIEWDNFNDPIRIDIGLLILNKFHVQYLYIQYFIIFAISNWPLFSINNNLVYVCICHYVKNIKINLNKGC